jgi:hypothetical protein
MVVLQGGRSPGLTQKTVPGSGLFCGFHLENLEGYLAFQENILGQENDPHAPFPKHLEDAVLPQTAYFVSLLREWQWPTLISIGITLGVVRNSP